MFVVPFSERHASMLEGKPVLSLQSLCVNTKQRNHWALNPKPKTLDFSWAARLTSHIAIRITLGWVVEIVNPSWVTTKIQTFKDLLGGESFLIFRSSPHLPAPYPPLPPPAPVNVGMHEVKGLGLGFAYTPRPPYEWKLG